MGNDTDKEKKTNKTTRDYVLEVLRSSGDAKESPLPQCRIVDRVIALKDKTVSEGSGYSVGSVQPMVSRALKDLCEKDLVIKVGKKCYTLYTHEKAKPAIKANIIDEVIFTKRNLLQVSTRAVFIGVKGDIDQAKELFRRYIGEKECYDVLEVDNHILILFAKKQDAKSELISELKKIVRAGYDCQDPKTMKKVKGKQMASETQETNGIEANATDK